MNRALTQSEVDVLSYMLSHASGSDGDKIATHEDRRRWSEQISDLRVVRECDCGLCPSIDFDEGSHTHRALLEAHDTVQNAMVMVFIYDDRVAALEVAPIDDTTLTMPNVGDIEV